MQYMSYKMKIRDNCSLITTMLSIINTEKVKLLYSNTILFNYNLFKI